MMKTEADHSRSPSMGNFTFATRKNIEIIDLSSTQPSKESMDLDCIEVEKFNNPLDLEVQEEKKNKRVQMLKEKFGVNSEEEMHSMGIFDIIVKEVSKNCIVCSLQTYYLLAPRKTRFLIFYIGIMA
jgi:hydroxymethylpyrimidine pyrophosphatase-like HAD family hydrolase